MRRSFLATLGALTLVSCFAGGCNQPVKPEGFIDKTGTLVVDPSKTTKKPLVFGDYEDGLVSAKFAEGYGCLDKNGGLAFVHPFRYIDSFSEGMAPFSVGKNAAEEMWGYINPSGETVIEPTYGGARQFSEGLAPVRMHKDDKGAKFPGKWCYIDKTGKVAIDKYFDEAQPFVDGVAVVTDKGKSGCIDKTGKLIVPAEYDKVYPVNGGIIVAAQGEGMGTDNRDQTLDYFDIGGGKSLCRKVIVPITLKNLRHQMWVRDELVGDAAAEADRKLNRPLPKDVTPGFREGVSIMQEGKKFSHMTPKFGRVQFGNVFDYVYPFSDGMAMVYDDSLGGRFGYIDTTQQVIITYKYWDASPFSNGLALVQETKDGPYGYIDKKGHFALPAIYDSARPFKDERALVGKGALLKPEP
jgi:hypothetical protein